jgi:Domain of unknown function (DUF4124)
MFRTLVLSVFLVFATGAQAQAQVYKCIDAGGKTTYLQSPCPSGAKSTAISRTVPPAAPQSEPAAGVGGADKADKAGKAAKASGPKSAAELEQDFRKRKQEQEKSRQKEEQKLAETKAREDNCRNSRAQIINLESGVRQSRIDEKGERQFLDEAGVEQEKANARQLAEQWCK